MASWGELSVLDFQPLFEKYKSQIFDILAQIAERMGREEGFEVQEPHQLGWDRLFARILWPGTRKTLAVLTFDIEGTPEHPILAIGVYPPAKGRGWFRWAYGPFESPDLAFDRLQADIPAIITEIPLKIAEHTSVKDWTPKRKKH